MNEMYVISFNSTHHAIKIDKILKENKITCITLPTPREISASCGMSIRFSKEDFDKILDLVDGLDYKGIYKIEKIDNERKVSLLK